MAEIAGLVLGAFPLLIEGLKLYTSGARTIGDMFEHEFILNEFRRDIEMEKTKFYDTYLQLLEDMSVDPSILAELEESPRSERWRCPEVRSALESRLRQSSILQVERATGELHQILQRLHKDFELEWNKEGTKPRIVKKRFKRFLGKLDAGLNKDHRNEQLLRIRRLNADIRTLVCGNPPMNSAPVINPRGNPAKQYGQIKEHAVSLYRSMKEKFQQKKCNCPDPHSVSLRLEMRTPNLKTSKVLSDTCFQLLFLRSIPPNPKSFHCWQLEMECLDSRKHHRETCQHQLPPPSSPDQNTTNTNPAKNDDCGLLSHTAAGYYNNHLDDAEDDTSGHLSTTKKTQNIRKVGIVERMVQYLGTPPAGTSISRPTSPTPSEYRPDSPNKAASRERRSKHVAFAGVPGEVIAKVPSRLPEDTCGLIDSLCSTINESVPNINNTRLHHRCLGILVNTQCDQRHRLRVAPRGLLPPQTKGTVSLETILNSPGNYPTPTLRDRLKLSVNIASALMQLYESNWLNEGWGKNDIFFVQGPDGPLLQMPLVHQVFQGEEASPESMSRDFNAPEWGLALCNRSVFCLGVILIEVWHWKPFSVLQEEFGGGGQPEFFTAQRLAKDLLTSAGAPYGKPVKLCIMGLEGMETQLDQEDFRNEVYKKIVYPLEENLMHFCGSNLADIYQDTY